MINKYLPQIEFNVHMKVHRKSKYLYIILWTSIRCYMFYGFKES